MKAKKKENKNGKAAEYVLNEEYIFGGRAFSALLYPPKQETISELELQKKVELAEELINKNPKEPINVRIIIEKLGCEVEVANMIIDRLYRKGIITPSK